VEALNANKGDFNTAVGRGALTRTTTGINNTGVGYNALFNNSTGQQNTAVGRGALVSNTTAGSNTAMGQIALIKNTTGDKNCAFGQSCLASNTTGFANTAMGYRSLLTSTVENNNTIIGHQADIAPGVTNSSAIGSGAVAASSNTIYLGSASATGGVVAYGPYNSISDSRVKININEDVPGLAFINKLRPITYDIDLNKVAEITHVSLSTSVDSITKNSEFEKAQNTQNTIRKTGLIAQEVQKAADDINYDYDGIKKPSNENDIYGLAYSNLVVPMIKAIQEQQIMIQDMQKQLIDLRNLIKN
jgi:hypothetical protein